MPEIVTVAKSDAEKRPLHVVANDAPALVAGFHQSVSADRLAAHEIRIAVSKTALGHGVQGFPVPEHREQVALVG